MFGLRDTDIDLISNTLKHHPDIEKGVIFGSRAMGNYKPGSDVDIALQGILKPKTLIEVSAELNQILPLPYKFDVVDYSSIADKPLRHHIDQYGKTFYERS